MGSGDSDFFLAAPLRPRMRGRGPSRSTAWRRPAWTLSQRVSVFFWVVFGFWFSWGLPWSLRNVAHVIVDGFAHVIVAATELLSVANTCVGCWGCLGGGGCFCWRPSQAFKGVFLSFLGSHSRQPVSLLLWWFASGINPASSPF